MCKVYLHTNDMNLLNKNHLWQNFYCRLEIPYK